MSNKVTECRMLSTSGLLGYGFPEASLKLGLERNPDIIGVDGGSTDPGPYYLGSGECLNSVKAMKRDLRLMLIAARSKKVPMVIGSCGGGGADPHLAEVARLAREIAREEGLKFRMATIRADQDRNAVASWVRDGRVTALRAVPELTEMTVQRSARIVGMMGAEPFMRALDQGAEVILAACATVNSIIRREKINEVDGVLIMDCNAVLLKTAEGMGDLYKSIGLQASRRLLYSGPQKKSLDDWRKLYNFRSSAQLKP